MKKLILFFILIYNLATVSAQSSCPTALNVTLGTYNVPSVNGTAPTSSCNLNGGTLGTAGVWYKFVAAQNANITVSTVFAGQNVDTRVMVYTGNCGNLNCLASNDDSGGSSSVVNFAVTTGSIYYIAFDNRWSSAGFNFKISENIIPQDRISFTNQAISSSGIYNNCVVDMNGDYLDDIVSVVSPTQIVISYQQTSGSFNSVSYTIPSTIIAPTWSIAAGDLDNNGFNDLLYGSGSGISFVKANATGTAYTSERKNESYLTQRSNFIDINNDGKLDAFVCDDNAPNRTYINNGTTLVHNQGGLGDFPSGGNYGSMWTDYDNDGDLDLFIAKCSGGGSGPGGNINELHRNNGNGTFTNVSVTANMADPIQTWSSAWGDFNNDGWMDALVGINSSSDGLNKLMKNNGDGTFSNMTAGSGYETITSLSREYVAYDFDNDGFLDVLGGGNTIMFGDGNFHFMPNPNLYNIDLYDRPIGDLNNDGFLDIQKGNTILMNNGNSNKWLKVTLKGINSNRNGIGARVEIYGSWGKQIRDVQSGTGFQNMSTLNTHFGIGQATAITKVIVRWPSGIVDTINNVTPNTTLNVVEGSSILDVNEVQNGSEIFTIYPNPSSDIVNFSTKKGFLPVEAKLYDMNGKMVYRSKVENNMISIKDLVSGVYVIILNDKIGKSYSQKLLKK